MSPVESIQVWCQRPRVASYALMLRPSTPPLPCQCSCSMPLAAGLANMLVMVLRPTCLPSGPNTSHSPIQKSNSCAAPVMPGT